MSVNVKPIGDRVLVKPAPAVEKTASGIIIPDTAKEKPQRGEVVAVGKGTLNENAGLYSFTAYNEINVQNTALRRARAGGSAAPPKTNARTTNALTRTFSPVQYSNVNGTVSNNYIKNFYGNNAPVSYH